MFSEFGIFANKELAAKREMLSEVVAQRSAEVALLRADSEKREYIESEEELVLALESSHYVPTLKNSSKEAKSFEPLSLALIFSISLFSSLFYLCICFIVKAVKRR